MNVYQVTTFKRARAGHAYSVEVCRISAATPESAIVKANAFVDRKEFEILGAEVVHDTLAERLDRIEKRHNDEVLAEMRREHGNG